MADFIKHECGIALVRLRKPLSFYIKKYGTCAYAFQKLFILMQKQRNRGQDGAGVANLKLDVVPGTRYISRYRSMDSNPLQTILHQIEYKLKKAQHCLDNGKDIAFIQKQFPYTGEFWLGHLRYGTHGVNTLEACHPQLRQNNWRSRSLLLAGNFNLTNVHELFSHLVKLGQHPKEETDTITVLEKIGHFLEEENNQLFNEYRHQPDLQKWIEKNIQIENILQKACKDFDGGYVMAGCIGHGSAFVVRDPVGIRPAYYYADEEIIVVASERPPIQVALNVAYHKIHALQPGHALLIHTDGTYNEKRILPIQATRACSFERIYFSSSTDPAIYQERKKLGALLVPQILASVNNDVTNVVCTYVPHTASVAFWGMAEVLDKALIAYKHKAITKASLDDGMLRKLLSQRIRLEYLIHKDEKLRTFITDDIQRDNLVANIYDTIPQVIQEYTDTILVLDDSIVRGTTLEKRILTILDRLNPKKIVIVSCAPQVRYPDCYGIDMSVIQKFVAFRAVIALLKEENQETLLDITYKKCLADQYNAQAVNHIKALYQPFSVEAITAKIAQIITPKSFKSKVQIIYQTVENLHKACPKYVGDWYFTGDYPTPGGNRIVNQAFINFMQGMSERVV